MKLRRVMALLPFMLLAASAAAGDIYFWRDAGGRLHYSDSPPTGNVDVQKRHNRTAADSSAIPAAASPAKPRTLAEKDMEFRKRRTEAADAQAKADKDKADAARMEENCRSLRGNLAALEGGQAIARMNEKGEREIMDDSQRQSDIARTRQQLEQNCK